MPGGGERVGAAVEFAVADPLVATDQRGAVGCASRRGTDPAGDRAERAHGAGGAQDLRGVPRIDDPGPCQGVDLA
ncbi:hypothetical protein [Nocardia fluminea]|uniref:hypothetical protein n=1 Tax=Nocardia fluminea TaxID=134984 RepID=UPI003D0D7B30